MHQLYSTTCRKLTLNRHDPVANGFNKSGIPVSKATFSSSTFFLSASARSG